MIYFQLSIIIMNVQQIFEDSGLRKQSQTRTIYIQFHANTYQILYNQADDAFLLATKFASCHKLNNHNIIQQLETIIQQQMDAYNHSKPPMQNWDEKVEKKQQSKFFTYGKLYDKGIKSIHKKQEIRKRQSLYKIEQQMKETTFHPKINEVSSILANQSQSMNKAKHITPKKINIQNSQYKQMKQLQECSFRPKINSITQKIVKNQKNRYNKLYKQAQQRNLKKETRRQEELEKVGTFKPKINSKKTPSFYDHKIFKQDQSSTSSKKLQSQQRMGIRKRQPLNYNPTNLPLQVYLQRKTINIHKECMPQRNTYKNQKSKQIFQQMVSKKLHQLFQQLDSDEDGIIGIKDIQQGDEIFKGLFLQMQNKGIELSEKQFLEIGFEYLMSLDAKQRGEFLYSKKKQVKNEQPKKLHKQNYNHRSYIDLYENGVKKMKLIQSIAQEQKSKRQFDQLRKCTFRPIINKYYD